jgi:hypothetical protein
MGTRSRRHWRDSCREGNRDENALSSSNTAILLARRGLMILGKIIITCILALLLVCSVILVCATSAGFVSLLRKLGRPKTKTRVFPPPLLARSSSAEAPPLRGYDTHELFREDNWLREIARYDQKSAPCAEFMRPATASRTQGFCAERVSAILAAQLGVRSDN